MALTFIPQNFISAVRFYSLPVVGVAYTNRQQKTTMFIFLTTIALMI